MNGHIVTVSTWSKAFIGMSTSVLSIHAAKIGLGLSLQQDIKKNINQPSYCSLLIFRSLRFEVYNLLHAGFVFTCVYSSW